MLIFDIGIKFGIRYYWSEPIAFFFFFFNSLACCIMPVLRKIMKKLFVRNDRNASLRIICFPSINSGQKTALKCFSSFGQHEQQNVQVS